MKALKIIGSDVDHHSCPWCRCHDRERHLLLYFRQLGFLENMRAKEILHFAAESNLIPLIEDRCPSRYIKADLFPTTPDVRQIDMLAISYPDESFDFLIANHVLEHVIDDTKALSELQRVLKHGGLAILQTPFSPVLEHMISDRGVTTSEGRLQLYGQEDHTRIYGRDIFERFSAAGFLSRVVEHDSILPLVDPDQFGVNRSEPLFLFQKI